MAKRKRLTTTKSIEKRIEEGRCKKDGKDYIPWYKVQDVASAGVSLKTFSPLTKRQHHLLSRLESNYFYILEWSEKVIDIKEQYAILDIDETIEIASSLGYKHPFDPKTRNIVPITTDFLIEIERDGKNVFLSRTLKYTKDLTKRTLQKFEIEKTYWKRRGIDWGIVTEQMIDKNIIDNIIWIRKAKSIDGIPDLDTNKVSFIEQILWNEIETNNRRIVDIATKVTSDLGLLPGTGLFVIRHLLANKIWRVAMNKPINPDTKLEILERRIPLYT